MTCMDALMPRWQDAIERPLAVTAYVGTPKSDNEAGGLACKPLRAGPKAPICVVVLLAKHDAIAYKDVGEGREPGAEALASKHV